MPKLRKATWAMLIWTVVCAVITIAWVSADVSQASELPVNRAVQVDDEFRVTLLSADPPRFRIENITTHNALFSYSDLVLNDSTGAEHEPANVSGQIIATVPASESIETTVDFGNLGTAGAVSYHWECDACDAGESIGRAIVFVLMGGLYWFGMLILFIVWLVSRPARVVIVSTSAESEVRSA